MTRSRGIATIDASELPEIVRRAAVAALAEAEARVPVGRGDLAASICVRPHGRDGAALVVDSPHALYVEYGTNDTEPQPFVRPAIRRAARRAMRDGLRAILRRA